MPVKKKATPRKKADAPAPKASFERLAAKAMASVAAGAGTLGKIVATAFTIPSAEPSGKPPTKKTSSKKKPKSPAR